MATSSSILAWRIPGTGEPGALPSMGSHRVAHDWSDLAAAAAAVCLQKSKCSFTRASFPCCSALLLPSDKSCSSQSFRHHRIPTTWLQHLGPVSFFNLTCTNQILPLELSVQGTWGKTLCRNNVLVVFLIPWGPCMCSEAMQHSHLTNGWESRLIDFKSLLYPHCVKLSNFLTYLHLHFSPSVSKSYYES